MANPWKNRVCKSFLFLVAFLFCTAFGAKPKAVDPEPPAAGVRYQFPEGFKWCVATAANQVEGYNTHSDWWIWEHTPGKTKIDGQYVPGKAGENAEIAVDHWNRVEDDTALMKSINVNMSRFSVEWAKIEPEEGVFDDTALNHYLMEVQTLEKYGITPFVTLFHVSMPEWLAEKGGWTSADMPAYFERFVRKVYEVLGDHVETWTTINEPVVPPLAGYMVGWYPPGRINDFNDAFTVMQNILIAHGKAYHALHEEAAKRGRPAMVGLAHALRVFRPARSWFPLDGLIADIYGKTFNWLFVDALKDGQLKINLPFVLNKTVDLPDIKGTQDFFGLNYYGRETLMFSLGDPGFMKRVLLPTTDPNASDLGWESYPEGFGIVLKEINDRFPKMPVYITENGLTDHDDSRRPRYIKTHVQALAAAIKNGADVRSYCHWTFTDNFEWQEGYAQKCGLFSVDRNTMVRTPKGSAAVFSKIAGDNAIDLEN